MGKERYNNTYWLCDGTALNRTLRKRLDNKAVTFH